MRCFRLQGRRGVVAQHLQIVVGFEQENVGGADALDDELGGVAQIGQETDVYISLQPVRQLDMVFMIDDSPSMAPKVNKSA